MRKVTFIILLLSFSAPAFGMSYSRKSPQPIPAVNEPVAVIDTPQSDSISSGIISAAVELICKGQFDKADSILAAADADDSGISALVEVISQYNEVMAKRDIVRKENLTEQLEKLAEFKTSAETNEPNVLDVFPVIVKIQDFSAESEKKKILEDKFVKSIIEQSIALAGDYESKGQWLDAMLKCYSWLTVLYKDNKSYSDHRELLMDRTLIKASLTDSPCESSDARYNAVKTKMLIRSLDVLEYAYVEPFYYSDMAENALKRMRQLAEVISFSESFDETITLDFVSDKVPAFIAGIGELESNLKQSPTGISKDKFIQLLNSVIALDDDTIKLPKQIVISHFSEAALKTLDPHTMLVWPKQTEDFEKSMTNEFSGVGIEISKADGPLTAASLLPGTPAYRSGIDAGDVIEAIDGEITRDMSITCAVSKITGPPNTKVVLTIRRNGQEETMDFEITRAKIVVPTIRGWARDNTGSWQYMVDPKNKVGYVRMTSFSGTTAAGFSQALEEMEADGLSALILDLRYNSGGYLQTAADIVDMFISEGIIVSSQPRLGLPTWEAAHKKGTHPDYPLVILINGGSASASEIVAGALADKAYSRAILLGSQSYGKGSVQTITDYPGGKAQLKYTMAHYHLPSGDKVKSRFTAKKQDKKDWGVMPHIEVEFDSAEIKKFIDIQRDNDILVSADHDDSVSEVKRHSLEETIQGDIQLSVAILVAKAKIIQSTLNNN